MVEARVVGGKGVAAADWARAAAAVGAAGVTGAVTREKRVAVEARVARRA